MFEQNERSTVRTLGVVKRPEEGGRWRLRREGTALQLQNKARRRRSFASWLAPSHPIQSQRTVTSCDRPNEGTNERTAIDRPTDRPASHLLLLLPPLSLSPDLSPCPTFSRSQPASSLRSFVFEASFKIQACDLFSPFFQNNAIDDTVGISVLRIRYLNGAAGTPSDLCFPAPSYYLSPCLCVFTSSVFLLAVKYVDAKPLAVAIRNERTYATFANHVPATTTSCSDVSVFPLKIERRWQKIAISDRVTSCYLPTYLDL